MLACGPAHSYVQPSLNEFFRINHQSHPTFRMAAAVVAGPMMGDAVREGRPGDLEAVVAAEEAPTEGYQDPDSAWGPGSSMGLFQCSQFWRDQFLESSLSSYVLERK